MGENRKEENREMYKVFRDSVHGHIDMHPVLVKIIDSPEFQRLRNIKQLGGGYYVYPAACHNRFEHCIGVAHLSGKLVRSLRARQPELGITDKDELCVQIAGLCHDLGHGPFSHTFEIFMKETSRDRPEQPDWKHEELSVQMFEHLLKKEDIKSYMNGIFNDRDIQFIKGLISGHNFGEQWPYHGRGKEKSFLYEIVNNHRTGIDVDRMDYFVRDCYHLGMKSNFSHERYIILARVCTDKESGKNLICVRDKDAMNMYEFFLIRNLLYHRAYHHRVVIAVELMIVDALIAADPHLKISEKAKKPETHATLTDDILHQIQHSTDDKLSTAKDIVRRILERDLYTCIGTKLYSTDEVEHLHLNQDKEINPKLQSWLDYIRNEEKDKCLSVDQSDFKLMSKKFMYGVDERNPMNCLRFYKKDDPNTAEKVIYTDEVSQLLPEKYKEIKVFFFYKRSKSNTDIISLAKKHINKFWSAD